MKFNADEIIAKHEGHVGKMVLAKAYASYNSASGKPTKRLLAMALQHDAATLQRLCAERGLSVSL